MLPIKLIYSPRRYRGLGERFHASSVIASAALLQPGGQRVACVRELRQWEDEEGIDVTLDVIVVSRHPTRGFVLFPTSTLRHCRTSAMISSEFSLARVNAGRSVRQPGDVFGDAREQWNLNCSRVVSATMREQKQFGLRSVRWLAVSLACLIIAVPVRRTWHSLVADAPATANTPVATKFQFVRLRYPGGIPDYVKNWYTDYPAMDNHLTTLLRRVTGINVALPYLVDPSSPAIFDFPLIYAVEPEQMDLRPRDAANLREYLARGGLWLVDDFHGDEEFDRFLSQLHRILPDAVPVELTTAHPLFHCFFQIDKIIQVVNDSIALCPECDQWENGPSGKEPRVFAVFDERGRISVLMAWNTDLGDGLEWADDPHYPEVYSAYAFRFLSNVVVYSMTQ
jgi:hypothetical protein